MKVVLFCGGYGMRMRDGTSDLPKPMQPVGPRPLLWHIMRYYAHHGHKDFILCLGYGAHHIKDYFLNYAETTSNDFVLHGGEVKLLGRDIDDWSITFVNTGLESPIGERLRRVRRLVEDDEMFLAAYADVLTDVDINEMITNFRASNAVATLLAAPPQAAFHCLELGEEGHSVDRIHLVTEMPVWVNGGYFVLRPEIFDYLPENGDLIGNACTDLAKEGRMMAHRHRGWWQPTDTIKERIELEALYQAGSPPWMPWARTERSPLQALIQSKLAG